MGQAPGPPQTQLDLGHAPLEVQPGGDGRDGLDERVGVGAQPDAAIHLLDACLDAVQPHDPARRRGGEVGAQHALEEPLSSKRRGVVGLGPLKPGAERGRLLADDAGEARLAGGVHLRKGEQHLDGGADAGERPAPAVGEPVERGGLAGIAIDVFGHVVHVQHEARNEVAPGVARAPLGNARHRRHPDVDQVLAGRGGEAGDRRGAAAADARLDRLERMGHEAPVEDGEDRAPEPDEVGAAERLGVVAAPSEKLASPTVEEEDPPVGVADEDPLREVGDEGGEPVPLLGDSLLRLADPRLDVALERLVLGGEGVDHLGQRLRLGPALWRDPVAGVGAEDDTGPLRQSEWRGDVLREEGAEQDGHDPEHRQTGQHEEAGVANHDVRERLALHPVHVGPEEPTHRRDGS